MTDIYIISHRYKKYALYLLCTLTLMGLFMMQVLSRQALLLSLIISFAFHYLCSIVYSAVWQSVSLRSPKMIPHLHLAASFIRLILAAIILLVYCFIVAQKVLIVQFAVVFIIYYLVMLLFDALFFIKVSKISNQ